MINETEIRIGNWFEHDGKSWSHRNETAGDNFNFRWDHSDWYGIGECTISLEVLNPIPLTPEIVVAGGFVSFDCDKSWEKNGLRLRYKLRKFVYLGENRSTIVHYVHQLQNLNHALTGEELEIKI